MVSFLILILCFTIVLTAAERDARAPRPVPNGRILAVGPLESEFARLEAEIPGFAGWHFDADGKTVVSLKDLGRKDEAFARIAPLAEAQRDHRAGGRIATEGVEFLHEAREARYSFLELAAFRHALTRNYDERIMRVDVDEVRNVLALGVAEPGDVGDVLAHVARLGIPAGGVIVEVTGRPKSRVDLSEYHRPMRGGSMFIFRTRDWSLAVCTLGINGVYYGSSSNAGFLTASHCSQYPWSYAGNPAYQNTLSQVVATEYDDPDYFLNSWEPNCPIVTELTTDGFPGYAGCRWSDAAFYRYTNAARPSAWGGPTIHTTQYNPATGVSTAITGSLPVTGDGYAVVGTYVHKMGSVTGETDGWVGVPTKPTSVTGTCVNVLSQPDPRDPLMLLLCQDGTNLPVDGGDSGAPVYRKYPTYVQWIGIFHSNDVQYSYHSPAWNVRRELPNFSY